MLHPSLNKSLLIVQLLVQPDHHLHSVLFEILEHVLEALRDLRCQSSDLALARRLIALLHWTRESEKVWRDVVPVSVLHLLVVLVLLDVELV